MQPWRPALPNLRSVLDRTVGNYLWQPWYDSVATPAVSKVFFPLSRAWAAAVEARGDIEGFHAAVGGRAMRIAVGARLIAAVERRRQDYQSAQKAWEAAMFGPATDDSVARAPVEHRRQTMARRLMALRVGFLPSHLERPFPSARFRIEDRAEVLARHAVRREMPDGGMTPDLGAPVGTSNPARLDRTIWHWMRFPTPIGCNAAPAEARLREPDGAVPRATLIFAHGIGMETEFWGEQGTIPDWFLGQGFRIIEPQGPWHARRRMPGFYGGEPIFARGPAGLLEYSWTHVRELGRWIAWTREREAALGERPRPVLLAGISLGALTVMQLLSWARSWPTAAQPDSALLIAPAASMTEVAYRGSLTGGMGVPEALHDTGWTEARVAEWSPLLDAGERPMLDSSKIVVVLGTVDEITPYASGEDLTRLWEIPPENLYYRPQGHFSVSLGLTHAPAPLRRTIDVALNACE